MKEQLLNMTLEGLTEITNPRFYVTERGFAARLYVAVHNRLQAAGMLNDGRILEMEYQKGQNRHGITQRPDFIYHIPVEYSHAARDVNNYAVWAFKRWGGYDEAMSDFGKLCQMFGEMNYPLGFFINVGSDDDWMDYFPPDYRNRMVGIAVWQEGNDIHIEHRVGSEM
jgi:hypothetical protein